MEQSRISFDDSFQNVNYSWLKSKIEMIKLEATWNEFYVK